MDRRIFCSAILAATMFAGGSAFAQQQQQPGGAAGAGSSSGTSASDQSAQPAGASAGASDQSGQTTGAGAQASDQGGRGMMMMMLDKDPDKRFVQMCAVSNMLELRGAEIAQQRAQSPEVKQLAQQIMQDHQKSEQDIQQTAQKIGVQVPQQLPHMKQDELQEFSSLQGDDFDKRYVSAVKAAHAAAVSKCSDEAKIAKNDDVKQLAQKLLPTLQAHGQTISQVAQAQGLGMEGLQAQPAGATIQPSGTSGGTSGSSGTSGAPSGTSGTETGTPGTSGGSSTGGGTSGSSGTSR